MVESLRKRRRTEPEIFFEEMSGAEAAADPESDEDLDAADIEEAQKAQQPLEVDAPAGFVIAKTTSKLRRLHFVGSCSRVPGVHYHKFDSWGQTCPPDTEFDLRCVNCFGRPVPSLEDSSSEDSSSSGCSSTTEVGAFGLKMYN